MRELLEQVSDCINYAKLEQVLRGRFMGLNTHVLLDAFAVEAEEAFLLILLEKIQDLEEYEEAASEEIININN